MTMTGNVSDSADIQAILADLQAEIHRHRQARGDLAVVESPDPLAKVQKHKWVNSHLPIGWPVMPRGFVPRLIAYAQKITRRLLRWYINPLVDQQNAFNSASTDLLATLHARVEEQEQRLQSLDPQIGGLVSQAEEHVEHLRVLSAQSGESGQRLVKLEEAYQQCAEPLQSLFQERDIVRLRLQRLEHWYRSSASSNTPEPTSKPSTTPAETSSLVDCFLLGALYRNEAQMTDRLRDYDDLFTSLHQAQQQEAGCPKPVLDIGCGRGELVAHLQELGLSAYGIDIDADAIQIGQAAGRAIQPGDAFAHLTTLADNSLAAVTLLQVIEHLEINDLLRLFELAAQKLAPGGFIIAETINPSCLFALSNWYLLDPGHRTPLHPQMTQFVMEQAGLWQVQIRFLHPVPEDGRLLALPADQETPALKALIQRINQNIAQLNHILYGPQDYAAIAYKPRE